MRKFRNIPALVTLLAGFVSSVVMIIQKYSLVDRKSTRLNSSHP